MRLRPSLLLLSLIGSLLLVPSTVLACGRPLAGVRAGSGAGWFSPSFRPFWRQ